MHKTLYRKIPRDLRRMLGLGGVARPWTGQLFARELAKARVKGPKNLSDRQLLTFCCGAYGHIARYWNELEPFLRELWHRIEIGRIRYTKLAICELMGVSQRRVQQIVAQAQKRETYKEKTGTTEPEPALLTKAKYIADITGHFESRLKPFLARGERGKYQKVYQLLVEDFSDMESLKPSWAPMPTEGSQHETRLFNYPVGRQ